MYGFLRNAERGGAEHPFRRLSVIRLLRHVLLSWIKSINITAGGWCYLHRCCLRCVLSPCSAPFELAWPGGVMDTPSRSTSRCRRSGPELGYGWCLGGEFYRWSVAGIAGRVKVLACNWSSLALEADALGRTNIYTIPNLIIGKKEYHFHHLIIGKIRNLHLIFYHDVFVFVVYIIVVYGW